MAISTSQGPSLEVSIRKKLKGFELNMELQAGRGCLGILGPSGCGKSMTLKSIAGIVTPDAGRIAIQYASGEAAGGRVLYDSSLKINERPQNRQVGYLFQSYALFPNMTVEENILTGLKSKRMRKVLSTAAAKSRVQEMVERFGLKGLEKRYPAQLSGGQQQRAALARIMAYKPEIILLDEPFSAMDSHLREKLRLELAALLKEYDGISVLVTHDRDEAYQLCDSMILMDQGKALAGGRTKELFLNPRTCMAARLTGCKNISRIRRIGTHRIQALDWGGQVLSTSEPVGDEITAVGIRAHDFEPLSQTRAEELGDQEGENLIPVGTPTISEMPFEWYITLENGLWWKCEKSIHASNDPNQIPKWLRVPSGALMLLTGEQSEEVLH